MRLPLPFMALAACAVLFSCGGKAPFEAASGDSGPVLETEFASFATGTAGGRTKT